MVQAISVKLHLFSYLISCWFCNLNPHTNLAVQNGAKFRCQSLGFRFGPFLARPGKSEPYAGTFSKLNQSPVNNVIYYESLFILTKKIHPGIEWLSTTALRVRGSPHIQPPPTDQTPPARAPGWAAAAAASNASLKKAISGWKGRGDIMTIVLRW